VELADGIGARRRVEIDRARRLAERQAESPTEMNPANPRLDEAQIAALAEVGTRVRLRDGEPLITAGVRRGGFFVVLEGAVEVIDRSREQPRTIARHEPGQFTGDIDILTRRASLVSAYARGETELLHVGSSDIRRIISGQPAVGETLLRAFISRREQLLACSRAAILVCSPLATCAMAR
jgi:thioredoxin reductase (NADPH)